MTKPSTTGITNKSTGQQLTATEFNTVNTALNAVIDDYASISEGVDADTLEGSTKAEVQTHAPASHGNEAHSNTFITSSALSGYEQQSNKGAASGYAPLGSDSKVPEANLPEITSATYGETKLWNKTKNDIPTGWHECDGTNGTEDLSLSNPSSDTVYIMYIGGEYTSMTARTINVTNNLGESSSYGLNDPFGNRITNIEDGSPFRLTIYGITSGTVYPIVTCTRISDDYTITQVYTISLTDGSNTSLVLVQYVDCVWTIVDD